MKTRNYLKLAAFAFAMLVPAAASAQGTYTITGNITGAEGKTVYLLNGNASLGTPLDSTVIRNGKFEFQGTHHAPRLLTVKVYPDDLRGRMQDNRYAYRPSLPLFIDRGEVTITGDYDDIPLDKLNDVYDYSKVKIAGSPVVERYVVFSQNRGEILSDRAEARSTYIRWLNSPARRESVAAGIELVNAVDSHIDRLREYLKGFIDENRDNIMGLYALTDNLNHFTAPELDELMSMLTPQVRNSEFAGEVTDNFERVKSTAVGAKFVDIEFQDPDGNTVRLSDYAGKGTYLLVEFWASWCGPCRADIPHLKEVYQMYHSDGFEILSVSVDDRHDAWTRAIDQEKMAWAQMSDLQGIPSTMTDTYNFTGVPACILIAPDGTIANRNFRGLWMDRELIKMYGNKFTNY